MARADAAPYGVEGGLAHNVEGICHMMGMGLAGHKELRCKLPTRAELPRATERSSMRPNMMRHTTATTW